MDNVLTKRVSLIELFYDLVFVYMISQANSLIHHLHHGVISPVTLAIFAVALTFISETEAKPLFTASCLFGGIGLFYIGLIIANHYNRIAISKLVIACFATTTVVGFLITFAKPTFAVFTLTTALVTLLNAGVLTTFMMKHN